MYMFIIVFIFVYGSIHFYFFKSYQVAYKLSNSGALILLSFLALMIISPIILNIFLKNKLFFLSSFTAYFGFIWMAFIFLFFSTHIVLDIYKIVIFLISKFYSSDFIRFNLSDKNSVNIACFFTFAIIGYGIFEAQNIKIENIYIKTDKLPQNKNSLKIVQISDTHFSVITGVKFAKKITSIINDMSPDIVVSTGDMIDRGLYKQEGVQDILKTIKASYGKYAVTGNHEFYSGILESKDFIEKSGFILINNEFKPIDNFIDIIGVSDMSSINTENKIISGLLISKKIRILLKHRPIVNPESVKIIDLQLSGHTHNGQIFPFRFFTSLFFKYNNGLYKLGENSFLYVSRGTGTWGPPVRFLSPPEISVIIFSKFH